VAALFATAGSGPSGTARSAYEEGRAALRARDYRAAVVAFERAAALDPQQASVFLDLGIARAALKDWDGALEAYQRTLALDPRSAKAHNNIGNLYFRQGRYDEAFEAYRRALELQPDYLLASYHLGWLARQLNRPEEAEQAFRRCLELRPRNEGELDNQINARFYLGALRFRARDYRSAASLMEQVLQVRPEHLEARYYLGHSYLRLDRVEEGRRQLEIHRRLVDSLKTTEPVASGGIR
jgi:tetratricopeptide (TPR) repeat protein